MKRIGACWLVAMAALMTGAGGVAGAQTLYVSETGSDTNPGTAALPLRTLQQAVALQGREILMTAGQYVFESPVSIPHSTTVEGGYAATATGPGGAIVWAKTTARTMLLVANNVGQSGVILTGPESGTGAALEDVTVIGGYVSVQMGPATRMTNVLVQGGSVGTAQLAGVLINAGSPNRPARIEQCQFEGGNTAVRLEGTGHATVTETMIRNSSGRGIFAAGTGSILVERCLITGSKSDGMAILAPVVAEVRNSTLRRNTGNGLVVNEATPLIVGTVLELNRHGVSFRNADGGLLRHCTVVRNRQSGVFVEYGWPDLSNNILAMNEYHGVEEADDQEIQDPDPEVPRLTFGGAVSGNFMWQNARGNYLDSDGVVLDSADAVNTALNIREVSGNLVVDPGFVDAAASDWRLTADSPAVDAYSTAGLPAVDNDGNPRAIDLPELGNETLAHSADAGALERQPFFRTNFGTFPHERSLGSDAGSPNLPAPVVLENRHWFFSQATAPVFTRIESEFLPGRMRLWSKDHWAFGAVGFKTEEVHQPKESVAIVRARIGATDEGPRPVRLRINAHETGELAQGLMLGNNSLSPTPVDFTWVYDVRQGGHRLDSPAAGERYPLNFAVDLLNLITFPYQSKAELRRLEVEFVSRAVYDAQFNDLLGRWTFTDGIEEWTTGGIFGYSEPTYAWDPTREALRMRQNSADTFGAWISPGFFVPPGGTIRVEARISSSTNDPANQQGFRLRLSPETFGFNPDILVVSVPNGPATPGVQAQTYTLYVNTPPNHEPLEKLFIYFDMWGFGARRDVTLYLEELSIFGVE